MKKTDIAMIILIATIGVLVSFFVARAILGDASTEIEKVKTIDPISAEVDEPDSRIFNSNAINPSVEVEIEGNGVSASSTSTSQSEE